jgi:hypothetical protein
MYVRRDPSLSSPRASHLDSSLLLRDPIYGTGRAKSNGTTGIASMSLVVELFSKI